MSTLKVYITKLSLMFSPLNEHKFRHDIESVSLSCMCNTDVGNNEHFLPYCPLFHQMRNDLFDKLSGIPGSTLDNLNSKDLCEPLLYGDTKYNQVEIKLKLEAAIFKYLFDKTTKLSPFNTIVVTALPFLCVCVCMFR